MIDAPEDMLVERLLAVFRAPDVDNPDLYITEFSRAIRGWDASVLDRAGDEVIRTCKFWPRPAEVNDIARSIAAADAAAKIRSAKPDREHDRPPPSPEMVDRVTSMMQEFRRNMAANSVWPQKKPVDWMRAQRDEFERMQRDSQNHGLHRLTLRSRAMSGDRDA